MVLEYRMRVAPSSATDLANFPSSLRRLFATRGSMKRPRRPPSFKQCLYTARFVLRALKQVGEPECCLVGGLAIALHGIEREMKV